MVRGSPCMCIRHTAQPLAAAAASAPGSRSARTSLMRPAPAALAARMTSGLLVSTEMIAVVPARSRSITGTTRLSSSSVPTGSAPGRGDSPPTSISSAPARGRSLCRRLRRLVGQRLVPAIGGLRRLARHDVLQLLLVDGLVLHERIGHEVQLVEGAREDLPRALVVALDHAAHFLVDRVRGHVRDLLVLRDAAAEEHL